MCLGGDNLCLRGDNLTKVGKVTKPGVGQDKLGYTVLIVCEISSSISMCVSRFIFLVGEGSERGRQCVGERRKG